MRDPAMGKQLGAGCAFELQGQPKHQDQRRKDPRSGSEVHNHSHGGLRPLTECGLEAQSRQAASSDLDKAISQLPTEAPKPIESTAKPQLTITSEPSGAEIEIDGEFIGNTPTTVTAKEGTVIVKVKKAGFQPWERTMKLNPGDKRTLNAEMVK